MSPTHSLSLGGKASITITEMNDYFPTGTAFLLDVEEYFEYEPGAYIWEPGWGCAVERYGDTHWFFIGIDGQVYYEGPDNHENKMESFHIGVCPKQLEHYETFNHQLDEMVHDDNPHGYWEVGDY